MKRKRIFLWVQGALCILAVILMCVSTVQIYQEGKARKAEHPLEAIYSPAIVAEKFAPIAPLCFLTVGFLIAGLFLAVRDENSEKPVQDAEISRDLIVSRVAEPTDGMRREQRLQKTLTMLGWGAFALCMVPVGLYLTRAEHFPQDRLEEMFYGLIRVFLPWTAVGIGCLMVCFVLRDRSARREMDAAQARLREEKAAGATAAPGRKAKAENPRARTALQAALIAAAAVLIVLGVLNGSALDVLYKAINICTECVGLG